MSKNPVTIVNSHGEKKDIFKYNGKKYELVDEVCKGGCQGCAFINRMDCATQGRTEYCRNGKIFKFYLKELD